MPFRHRLIPVRWACQANTDLFLPQELPHDPPQTTRRHRYHRFRRSHRLLGHDCSEERRLPGYKRLINLRSLSRLGLPVVRYLRGSHRRFS